MTPQFANQVLPIFKQVLDLLDRMESGQQIDIQTERNQIRDRINNSLKSAGSVDTGMRQDEVELAKRAIIFWIDEVLTEAMPSWQDRVLEVEFYGPPKSRAWKFYVEGETEARHASPNVAEIWYLALVLGFKGDIRDAFRNHLNRDLPGNQELVEAARQYWGKQLEQRVQSTMPADLPAEPLEGNVARLKGESRFTIASVVCGVLLTSFFALLLMYFTGGEGVEW